MEISISMNCPSCGGALSIEEGSRTTSCPYCSSLLAVEGDGGVSKIMFTNNLDRDKAIASAKKWMKGGFKARDLPRKAEITECYPIYVPFWKCSARAAGWVCGWREETRGDGKNSRTERIPMEKMVMRDFNWNQVACDAGDIGIEHLKNLAGKAVLHDEGSIPTFEVTTSPSDSKAMAVESIRRTAVNSAGVPHITFSKVHVFPGEMELIYYPVWMVRYKYSGRMYFATVDGITGGVLSGRAPGDAMWRSVAMTLGMAAGGFGTSLGLGILLNVQDDSSGLGILVILFCLSVAGGAFMFFRHGSEMTTGDVKGGYQFGFRNGGSGVGNEAMADMLKIKVRR
ncbi:hypothetical protein CUJ83_13815 [Methanocella sp. CWC-04]|uniref:Zinc ribbon domain-containing protein n=1 Tax=Methanooceanicella nereidis TaxID=2052831 RepID=A0AAP2RGA7_9EURY|nr:hypothetical protein [Methanocella sp. CWC-04]MCD1296075.1 hypothetical protein [Methanocella sp. CWC-04]